MQDWLEATALNTTVVSFLLSFVLSTIIFSWGVIHKGWQYFNALTLVQGRLEATTLNTVVVSDHLSFFSFVSSSIIFSWQKVVAVAVAAKQKRVTFHAVWLGK